MIAERGSPGPWNVLSHGNVLCLEALITGQTNNLIYDGGFGLHDICSTSGGSTPLCAVNNVSTVKTGYQGLDERPWLAEFPVCCHKSLPGKLKLFMTPW